MMNLHPKIYAGALFRDSCHHGYLSYAELRTVRFSRQYQARLFQSLGRLYRPQKDGQEPFSARQQKPPGDKKSQWNPTHVGLGIGFLGLVQLYRLNEQEKARRREDEDKDVSSKSVSTGMKAEGYDSVGRPKRRDRIRPTGPWQVQVMSTLPLKTLSRLWGRFNELNIPYYLRVPGFKIYSFLFGVNLSEVSEPDLHTYPNLASFFYRTLKPGARPLDPNLNAVLSPADGRVLQFGTIEGGEVEQVKGMTYSLDALLGTTTPEISLNPSHTSNLFITQNGIPQQDATIENRQEDEEVVKHDEEFARVNGISYTLPNLFSGSLQERSNKSSLDASTESKASSEVEVKADLALGGKPWHARITQTNQKALYYVVIYLAPGDYHRFHSPTAWIAERRRHFAGELYSVSPYLQRTLPGLFVLNERVVLIGRWRWGFFSMTPVGATNVGSIVINFDRELRTNSLLTDTAADRAAEEAEKRGEPFSGYAEATYDGASRVLGGHALKRGEEMGGFRLGSTVVLVFEAPKRNSSTLDEYRTKEMKRKEGWTWAVEKGQKIQMGQAVGYVDES